MPRTSATRRWAAYYAGPWLFGCGCAIALACVIASCQRVDLVAVAIDSGADGSAGSSAGADAGADADAGAGGTAGESGPVPDAGADAAVDGGVDAGPLGGVCLDEPILAGLREGDLPAALASAAPANPSAVCSCRGYVGPALTTDVWGAGTGGDVASNELGFNVEGDSAIAGSLSVAGSTGISVSPDTELSVGGNLEVEGPLRGALAAVSVGGNAAIGDDIDLMDLRVSGTLTQPAGALLTTGTRDIGAQESGEVTVAPPCPCGPSEIADIAAIAEAALPATEPAMPHACPWPAAGSTRALFVPGDLSLQGDLVIGAGAGEDLALIVEGNVLVAGHIELGSAAHRRRVHLYVGGGGTVQFNEGGTLVGTVYAPNADLVFRKPLTVYGAVFAERVSAESALTVHDDPSLR